MDNQKAWSKEKLKEWQKFWDSEMGKEAIDKMESLKQQCLNLSLQPSDPNSVVYYVGRAGGIDLVLQDIQAGIDALAKLEEKEEKAAKK